mgnify:CR=1 FL=1
MIIYMQKTLEEHHKEYLEAESKGDDTHMNYLEGVIDAYEHLIAVAEREED